MPVGDVEFGQDWSGALGSAAVWVAVVVLLALIAASWWMASRNGASRPGRRPRQPVRRQRAEDESREDELVSRR